MSSPVGNVSNEERSNVKTFLMMCILSFARQRNVLKTLLFWRIREVNYSTFMSQFLPSFLALKAEVQNAYCASVNAGVSTSRVFHNCRRRVAMKYVIPSDRLPLWNVFVILWMLSGGRHLLPQNVAKYLSLSGLKGIN